MLDGHEKVLLSCVIGVKDAYKMQRVKAFVVLKPGIEPSDEIRDELMAYCKERIAKYAMPKEIEFRAELPKTLVGKVAYRVPGGRGGGPGRRAGVVTAPKARIWELDAFRGVAILAVILVHLLFDLRYFLGLNLGYDNTVFQFIMQYGGVVFVVLSGICVTLGRRSLRRGLIVFGCAMAVTLVTEAMVWLGLDSGSIVVRFGVLHLLGLCMLLWPLLRRLPTGAMAVLGLVLVVLGYWFPDLPGGGSLALPPGPDGPPAFSSSDYFPLLPPPGLVPPGRSPGPDGLPGEADPAAPGQCPGGSHPLFQLVRPDVPVPVPGPFSRCSTPWCPPSPPSAADRPQPPGLRTQTHRVSGGYTIRPYRSGK